MIELVFATNNQNKLKEVQALMPLHIKLLSLKEIGCVEDIPETQDTIEGNAIQKIEFIKENYGYDGFADDTGLEVNALDGRPGVYSARYAGQQRDANDNMDKLIDELKDKQDHSGHFKTVIALMFNNRLHTFTGLCEGTILNTRRGTGGFGYDPIFQPIGYEQTFAEMPLQLKNEIGHRGKAIMKLIQFLKSNE